MAACWYPAIWFLVGFMPVAIVEASPGKESERAGPRVLFTDVAEAAGIDFVETIGDDAMTNIVESTGIGCGFFDYDGDGWMDIYMVSGCWKQGVSDAKLGAKRREKLAKPFNTS